MQPLKKIVILSHSLAFCSLVVGCGAGKNTRTHYDNPFAESKKGYVNPKWAEQARADGGEAIANESSAIWLNQISDIKPYEGQGPRNGMGLREHLDAALEQQADLLTFVMYNLPGKGCSELYGNITPTEIATFWNNEPNQPNMDRYKKQYIDEIIAILSEDQYAGISIVAIIEPDTLINLTESSQAVNCIGAGNSNAWGYTEGVRYALTQFSTLKNIHSYIDVGHSGIAGWPEALSFATMFMKGVITGFQGLSEQAEALSNEVESGTGRYINVARMFVESAGPTPAPGWGAINGFISNVANYIPLEEPYLPNESPFELDDYSDSLRTAMFYDWNPMFGELDYSQEWLDAMRAYGADETLGMLIDTSRNGWGGPNRPIAQPDTVYENVDRHVETMRLDRREHRRSFCNQEGAGIGQRPQANPVSFIDAYVWAKPIGESDGMTDAFSILPYDSNSKLDVMCDPYGRNHFAEDADFTAGQGIGTGAMKDAPHYGKWFSYAFKQLLENAYPPLE